MDPCLYHHHSCARVDRNRPIPNPRLEGLSDCIGSGQHGGIRNNHRIPSITCASRSQMNPIVEQVLVFFAVFNGSGTPSTWIANHRNHHANADTIDDVSSPRRRLLVGASEMAVSVGTILDGKVESGHDPAAIHDLGQGSDSSCHHVHLFRLPLFRLGGTVLGRCDPARLRLAYASFRKQPASSETRSHSRHGLQPEHLVARTASTHSVGRELPPKSSLLSGLSALQPALVADRSWLVRHPRSICHQCRLKRAEAG